MPCRLKNSRSKLTGLNFVAIYAARNRLLRAPSQICHLQLFHGHRKPLKLNVVHEAQRLHTPYQNLLRFPRCRAQLTATCPHLVKKNILFFHIHPRLRWRTRKRQYMKPFVCKCSSLFSIRKGVFHTLMGSQYLIFKDRHRSLSKSLRNTLNRMGSHL